MRTTRDDGTTYAPLCLLNEFAPRLRILVKLAEERLERGGEDLAGEHISYQTAEYVRAMSEDFEDLIVAAAESQERIEGELPWSIAEQIARYAASLEKVPPAVHALLEQLRLAAVAGVVSVSEAEVLRGERWVQCVTLAVEGLNVTAGERAVSRVAAQRKRRRAALDAGEAEAERARAREEGKPCGAVKYLDAGVQ